MLLYPVKLNTCVVVQMATKHVLQIVGGFVVIERAIVYSAFIIRSL